MISQFFSPSSRRRFSKSPQVCEIQKLEDRTLLSGNVSVSLNAGQLTVLGDAADNDLDVVIDQNGGLHFFGFNGTTVNGQPELHWNAPNLHSVIANMGEGNDDLYVYGGQGNPSLSGQLWVNMAAGNDYFYAGNIDFQQSVAVYGQAGHDTIDLYDMNFKTGYFDGGTGDDAFLLDKVSVNQFSSIFAGDGDDLVDVSNSSFGQWLNIHGQQGNDEILLDGVNTGGHLYVAGGLDNDTINILNSNIKGYLGIYGGYGDDLVHVGHSQVGAYLWMTGSEGNDSLTVDQSQIKLMVAMYGQGGNDFIDFSHSSAGYVHLNGGDGADDVRSTSSESRSSMTIYSGFGDDLASVIDTTVEDFLLWNGGWGNDGFGMSGSNIKGAFFAYGLFGNDIIGMTNNIVHGNTWIDLGLGDDAAILSDTSGGPNTFQRNFWADLGPGNDVVQVDGIHNFNGLLSVLGGGGHDRSNIAENQNVAFRPLIIGIETQSDATTRDRIDALLNALANLFPQFNTSPLASLFTAIFGDNPQVILVIDISGSTSSFFQGTPVGDLNGDGLSDTILDAEIAAVIAFNDEFRAANIGSDSTISVVVFDSSASVLDLDPVTPGIQKSIKPNADINANGIPDFNEAVMALRDAGATNFEAALQETITTFTEILTTDGDANVIFLSDGFNNTGGTFDDEVLTLLNNKTKLIAFGVGQGADLPQLQTIDPKASIVDSTDDFINSLAGLI